LYKKKSQITNKKNPEFKSLFKVFAYNLQFHKKISEFEWVGGVNYSINCFLQNFDLISR